MTKSWRKEARQAIIKAAMGQHRVSELYQEVEVKLTDSHEGASEKHDLCCKYEELVGVYSFEMSETDRYAEDQEAQGKRCSSLHDALSGGGDVTPRTKGYGE